jgi:hypothetical protein
MKEKKHRVEDALQATRAALEEGIVPGGGVALLQAAASTKTKLEELEGDEKTGSQSYVPPDAKDDKALKMAADLLHGIKSTASTAPAPASGDKAAVDKPANKAAN